MDKTTGERLGIDAYIVKPADYEEFMTESAERSLKCCGAEQAAWRRFLNRFRLPIEQVIILG